VESDLDDTSDEIWRPGYDGPPPVSMPIRLAPSSGSERVPVHEHHSPEPTRRFRTPSPRTVVGILAVVATSSAAALITIGSGDSPADSAAVPPVSVDETVAAVGEQRAARDELPDVAAISGVPFAGADPKRLPGVLDQIWSASVDASEGDDVWVEVVDRRQALVAIGSGGASPTGSTRLEALDAESGVTEWSSNFEVPLRSVTFVAANSDSIALIVGGTLTGVHSATGEAVWEVERDQALVERDVEHLVGTDLLAVDSSDGTSTLIDMTTGETVGRLGGQRIATDYVGGWYVRQGTDIVRYELGDGFQEPSRVVPGIDDPVAVMIGRDVLTSGPDGWKAAFASDGWARPEALANPDDVPTATAIVPMLGNTFVVAGTGSIVGAELDGRAMRSAWTRDGAVTATYTTERGFLIHAATEGGAVQTIYDGRTGDVVATLTMTSGVFDRLVVAGNGILTKKVAPDGTRLAGLDLDGREMWSIRDVASASVGDRLIVTTTRLDDGSILLDAVGEPATVS